MKIILGDNQFFGINHYDLEKGVKTKSKFNSVDRISSFINESLSIGLDGFMINSNALGYEVVKRNDFDSFKEVHYSIPYPHKYANMVNENGMVSLLKFVYSNSSIINNLLSGAKFLFTANLKYLTRFALDFEIPKNLKKGSHVYLQNVITDLLLGIGREDILFDFITTTQKRGYNPGIITLNPVLLNLKLNRSVNSKLLRNLIVCFNINKAGFNVYPCKKDVEELIASRPKYKLMGMSILASGSGSISESIDYVKKLNLDYVVFGSSNIENVASNFMSLKN